MLLFALLFFAVFLRLQSQDSFALRFDGKSDGMALTLYLERFKNSVSGNLFVFLSADSSITAVSRMELIGKMTDETSFSLKQTGFPDPCLKGSFADEGKTILLTGNCGPFRNEILMHQSVKGQMGLVLHRFSETTSLKPEDPFSPKANLEMDAILPQPPCNVQLANALIAFASIQAGADSVATSTYDSLMYFAANRFSDQYRRLAEGDHGQSHRLPDWERIQQMQVVLNEDGLICIEKTVYAYSGGANGMTNSSYLIVDDSGNTITYKDIFREDSYPELSALIDQKLRQVYSLDAKTPLSQAGFFSDTIQPNENLYLSHDGLTFVYNVYEVAPRSMGPIRVKLLPEELEPLLEPDIQNERIRRIFHPANVFEP